MRSPEGQESVHEGVEGEEGGGARAEQTAAAVREEGNGQRGVHSLSEVGRRAKSGILGPFRWKSGHPTVKLNHG